MSTKNVKVFLSAHEVHEGLMFHIRVEKFRFPEEYYNLKEKPIASVTKTIPRLEDDLPTLRLMFSEVQNTLKELGLEGYSTEDVDYEIYGSLYDLGRPDAYAYNGKGASLFEKLRYALSTYIDEHELEYASEDPGADAILRAANWVYAKQHQCLSEEGAMGLSEQKLAKRRKELDEALLAELKTMATFEKDFSSFKLKPKSRLHDDFYLFSSLNSYLLEKE
jgi:hypothetical protein